MEAINVQDEAEHARQNDGEYIDDDAELLQDNLPKVCKDCGMEFDDAKQFGTHVSKFCQGTKYESVDALDRALREIGGNRLANQADPAYEDLKLDDLKDYIKVSQDLKYARGQERGPDGRRPLPAGTLDQQKKELIDRMTLDELRNFFQSEHQRQEDLENYALRSKEKEMIDQLN